MGSNASMKDANHFLGAVLIGADGARSVRLGPNAQIMSRHVLT